GGSGLELVHRDLQLLSGALQLRFRDANELSVGKGGKKRLLGRERRLVTLVYEPGAGCVLGCRGRTQVGEPLEPVEQLEGSEQAARVRVAGWQARGAVRIEAVLVAARRRGAGADGRQEGAPGGELVRASV